jgi:hypothetical protein
MKVHDHPLPGVIKVDIRRCDMPDTRSDIMSSKRPRLEDLPRASEVI